jgi:hypothetical protein
MVGTVALPRKSVKAVVLGRIGFLSKGKIRVMDGQNWGRGCDKIRGVMTRILREGWDADFDGGLGGNVDEFGGLGIVRSMKIFVLAVLLVNSIIVFNAFLIDPRIAGRYAGELVAINAAGFLFGIIPYLFFRKRFKYARIVIALLCSSFVVSVIFFGWESRSTELAIFILFLLYPAMLIEKWLASQRASHQHL